MYRLLKLNPVIGEAIFAAGFFEIGKVWGGPPGTPNLPFDVSGAAVMKSFIGPIYGGVSGGNRGRYAWFLGWGRVF
jgi:NTE family protein